MCVCDSHTFVAIIVHQNERIHGLLEKCTYDHEARVEILRKETHERAISDAKWQQIQQNVVPYVSLIIEKSYISLEEYARLGSIDNDMRFPKL